MHALLKIYDTYVNIVSREIYKLTLEQNVNVSNLYSILFNNIKHKLPTSNDSDIHGLIKKIAKKNITKIVTHVLN